MQTDARRKATRKYAAKTYDIVPIKLLKESRICKEKLQKWAKNAGLSVNKYVITAIIEKAQRDGELPTGDDAGPKAGDTTTAGDETPSV